MNRLRKLVGAAGVAFALHAGAQAPEPIRIGLLIVDSGPFASFQPHLIEPAKFAVEEMNKQGGILGRKVELVVQAHAGTPASALAAAQKLAQQDKALILTGMFTSAMSQALAPRMSSLGMVMLDSSSTSDETATRACNANYFHLAPTDTMIVNAMRNTMAKSGAKTWNVIAPDYAVGHDFDKRFRETVAQQGGTVQTTVFAPLGTADFGSHISQLAAKPADGLAVIIVGADATTLAKQQKQFGLFAKYKVVLSTNFTSEVNLASQGDSTVGVYSVIYYSPGIPGPRNTAFVKAWTERMKRPPSYIEAETYHTTELYKAALESAKSTDVAAVRKAFRQLRASTIYGDVEMRAADQQLIRPVTVSQVEAAGDGKARLTLRSVETGAAITPKAVLNCE